MSILGNYGGFLGFGSGGMGSSQGSGNSSGSSSGSSKSETQIVPGMMGVYSQLLGLNQQNYGNVMNAYQSGQNAAAAQLPGIYGGYNTLKGDVMNTLGMGAALGQNGNWGVAAPAAQAIKDNLSKTMGKNIQDMASAGLGNTTVRQNLQSQAASQANKAYADLGAQLATQAAQQQAQIGQAGLGAQMQGLGMQTGLYGAQGGALANYKYANTAGDLTGQYSQSQQSSQQQSQQAQESQNQQQGPGYSQQGQGGGLGTGSGSSIPGVPGGPAGGGGAGGVPGAPSGGSSGGYTGTMPGLPGEYKGPGGTSTTNTGADKPSTSGGAGAGADKPGTGVSGAGGDPSDIGAGKGGTYPGQEAQGDISEQLYAGADWKNFFPDEAEAGNELWLIDHNGAWFTHPNGRTYLKPGSKGGDYNPRGLGAGMMGP